LFKEAFQQLILVEGMPLILHNVQSVYEVVTIEKRKDRSTTKAKKQPKAEWLLPATIS
jgi:hypothetical protein